MKWLLISLLGGLLVGVTGCAVGPEPYGYGYGGYYGDFYGEYPDVYVGVGGYGHYYHRRPFDRDRFLGRGPVFHGHEYHGGGFYGHAFHGRHH